MSKWLTSLLFSVFVFNLPACARDVGAGYLPLGDFSCRLPAGFYDATGSGLMYESDQQLAIHIRPRNLLDKHPEEIVEADPSEVINEENVRGIRLYEIELTMEEGWKRSFHMIRSSDDYISIFSADRIFVIDMINGCDKIEK